MKSTNKTFQKKIRLLQKKTKQVLRVWKMKKFWLILKHIQKMKNSLWKFNNHQKNKAHSLKKSLFTKIHRANSLLKNWPRSKRKTKQHSENLMKNQLIKFQKLIKLQIHRYMNLLKQSLWMDVPSLTWSCMFCNAF